MIIGIFNINKDNHRRKSKFTGKIMGVVDVNLFRFIPTALQRKSSRPAALNLPENLETIKKPGGFS